MPVIYHEEMAPNVRRASLKPTQEEAVAKELRKAALDKACAAVSLPPDAPPWAQELLDKLNAVLALLQSR